MTTTKPGADIVATVRGRVEARSTVTGTLHVRLSDALPLVTLPIGEGVHVHQLHRETPTLEQVLEDHRPLPGNEGELDMCECGVLLTPRDSSTPDRKEGDAAFVAHLAEQLRAAGVAL